MSKRAAASGEALHAGDWARVAGLWHDLGKYSDAFQSYLRTASSPDPHIADASHATGRTDLVHDRYPVLASPELHYSDQTGLDLDRSLVEALVI